MSHKKDERMRILFDEKTDYFAIFSGKSREYYEEHIEPGIMVLKDRKTGEVIGIGIRDFVKRTKVKSIELNLPFKISLKASS